MDDITIDTIGFKKSIASSLLISIGCYVFLSCQNNVVGSFLFSIALYLICKYSLLLFTGKVGYFDFKNVNDSILKIIFVLISNAIFCVFLGTVIGDANENINIKAMEVVNIKLFNKNEFRTFIDSIFCGSLMFFGVDCYKTNKSELAIIYCVMVFILCGFEHCVANFTYFSIAKTLYNQESILFMTINIVGNALGAIITRLIIKK